MATTLKATSSVAVSRASVQARRPAQARRTVAVLGENFSRAGKAALAGAASLAITFSANAALVKLGSDTGALIFDPATVTIKAGESVTWKNNAGFPHNVVFDEDAVPDGVNVDALSHEDYLNAPGQEVSTKFTEPGTYGYYCEPHQGAGMAGKVVVQ